MADEDQDEVTGPILVGVDGSERSAEALRWGLREGRLRERPVVALLAWGRFHQFRPDRLEDFDRDYGEADAREALAAYVGDAVGADAAQVGLEVAHDLPGRALIERSPTASLLVLGSRGLGGFADLLIGSVTHHCLHHSACPVAVIHADHPPVPAGDPRIVVGVDGSEPARRALAWAVEEADRREAHLDVVHAWQVGPASVDPYGAFPVDPTVFEEVARRTLEEVLAGADVGRLSRPPEHHLVSSGAAQGILERAEGADLIVVGSRGVGGFKGLLVGSTSNQVVHHARCPVVVVPARR